MIFETLKTITAHPAFMLAIITLALFSILTFAVWTKKNKLWLLYAHLFFVLTPLFMVAIKIKCGPELVNYWVSFCTIMFAKFIIYAIPLLLILTFAIGYIAIPVFYSNKAKKHDYKPFKKLSETLKIPASMHLIDSAKPTAFTVGKKIFISIGMFEILSRKEMDAVMLHELSHVKQHSSLNKFSEFMIKIFSPIAWFANCKTIQYEELLADNFARQIQNTSKFLNSAKKKIEKFKI